ncbi:MAG: LD-carboxypeptidase [Eubacteriales bacterium]|nr:LD-carboxypeptidase [Eubacteriales bacterium]MDD4122267.1 LD-carboxypeptidase [Eubacteriales bacterium]MDD4629877.1 LD-carboxypeptidase [Eubacteriales bacterium]
MCPMIRPKCLKHGNRIALIAPSSPVDSEQLMLAVDSVRFLGMIPVIYPSATKVHGYLSGSDTVRAADIVNAFANPAIDAVFCLRGGYGVSRILEKIDYRVISKNPKLLLGYSDITALHIAINQLCNLVTLHSPMPSRGWETLDSVTLGSLTECLFSPEPIGQTPVIEGQSLEIINAGVAEGPIIGGNLSVLNATLGSPYEINTKNKILFIEDVNEKHYQIDRGLTALALAGKFKDCVGIILGTWADCGDPDLLPEQNLSLHQIFDEIIKPFGKPTVNNLRAGHIYPQISIPMGVKTRLDTRKRTVEFLEAATQ